MASAGTAKPLVVVGVDGSAESAAALWWAAHYAEAVGATIRAVMSWHFPTVAGSPPKGVAPRPVTDEIRRDLEDTLASVVAQVYRGPEAGAVETKISYGHPAQVLIEESKEADLLVVGNRGHGSFVGMYAGSISMHCVNQAACPVVVVRDS